MMSARSFRKGLSSGNAMSFLLVHRHSLDPNSAIALGYFRHFQRKELALGSAAGWMRTTESEGQAGLQLAAPGAPAVGEHTGLQVPSPVVLRAAYASPQAAVQSWEC